MNIQIMRIKNERRDITVLIGKKIEYHKGIYYDWLYSQKLVNLVEMDKFIEIYKLFNLT